MQRGTKLLERPLEWPFDCQVERTRYAKIDSSQGAATAEDISACESDPTDCGDRGRAHAKDTRLQRGVEGASVPASVGRKLG
jgi:hypothetical protein